MVESASTFHRPPHPTFGPILFGTQIAMRVQSQKKELEGITPINHSDRLCKNKSSKSKSWVEEQ